MALSCCVSLQKNPEPNKCSVLILKLHDIVCKPILTLTSFVSFIRSNLNFKTTFTKMILLPEDIMYKTVWEQMGHANRIRKQNAFIIVYGFYYHSSWLFEWYYWWHNHEFLWVPYKCVRMHVIHSYLID